MPTATKRPLNKISQLEATRLVLADLQPRTLKQIASEVRKKTRRPTTGPSISARLRDLRKPPYNLTVNRTPGEKKGVYLYSIAPTTLQEAKPANPIGYGTAASNVEPTVNTPVAGSRSALAFADSLR